MYIAICIMLAGIIFGRLTRNSSFFEFFKKLPLPAILLLLFLLGTSIGSNEKIMAALPLIGGAAFLLTIGAMAGSIFCTWLIRPIIRNKKIEGKK